MAAQYIFTIHFEFIVEESYILNKQEILGAGNVCKAFEGIGKGISFDLGQIFISEPILLKSPKKRNISNKYQFTFGISLYLVFNQKDIDKDSQQLLPKTLKKLEDEYKHSMEKFGYKLIKLITSQGELMEVIRD